MDDAKLRGEILALKEERGAVIIAHNYQRPEIQDIADFTGDSLELSRKAAAAPEGTIVFCGVRFMAETAKILAPAKKVLLPNADAGCFMADMIRPEDVRLLRAEHPGAAVVAYVNTNADVKAEIDVACTSANALKVVESLPNAEIIFVPDRNLGAWVQKHTAKKLWFSAGFCPVHERMTLEELLEAKRSMPDAELLVHPECRSELQDAADAVLSTSQMLRHAQASQATRFLVATEAEMLHRLRKENPGKEFFSAGPARVCVNMKKTTLLDLRDALRDLKHEITLDPALMERARRPLEAMVALG